MKKDKKMITFGYLGEVCTRIGCPGDVGEETGYADNLPAGRHAERYKVVAGKLVVKSAEDLAADEVSAATRALDQWRETTKCGPLQLRRAIRASGLMDTVKTYMETAPEETAEAWEYATEIYRMDPLVLGVQAALGKTDAEVDDLFRLALTFL